MCVYKKQPVFCSGYTNTGFPGGASVKNNRCANAGDIRDTGSIPGLGRSPGGGHGNPLQYCLENPMDRGAWWAIIHGFAELDTTKQITLSLLLFVHYFAWQRYNDKVPQGF